MLENFIRKMKKGTQDKKVTFRSVTAFIVFGAIVLVFVLFGLHNDLAGGGLNRVASVNGRIISVGEFQREQEKIKNQYASLFGNAQDLGFQMDFFSKQAVESLIQSELIHQYAEKAQVFVADTEVARRIMEIPAFQKDGRFQRDYYSNYLAMTRQSPHDFEVMLKKQIQGIRLRALFEASLRPTQLEVANIEKLKSVQMNYEFVKMNEADFAAKNKIKDSDVKVLADDKSQEPALTEFFNANSREFKGDFATNRFQVAQKFLQKKKFDESVKDVETAVSEKDLAKVQAAVSKHGYKWDETGAVDLSQDVLPKVGSAQVGEAATKLSRESSLYDKVVREGQDRYVLRLKDIKTVAVSPSKEDNQVDFLKRRRGDGAFNEWVQDKRKVSKISIHPQIFSNKN